MTDENGMVIDDAEPGGGGPGLPVDPLAILLALWRLRWWAVGGLAAAMVAAVLLATAFATRTYRADTLMLYQAPLEGTPEAQSMPSLLTLLNMVKLPENLAEVNERLQLESDPRSIGGAVNVELQPKSTLLLVRAQWDDAEKAAAIANTVRDVFLENQTQLRRTDAEAKVQDVERRLESVRRDLAIADDRLTSYTTENRIVNLTEEARAMLTEYADTNLLLEQAKAEKRTLDLQVENADRLIAELEQKLSREREAQAAMSDQMSETNIRIQRLRELINDDRESRYNDALLQAAKGELDRAEKGLEQGATSPAEVEEARARYESLKARAVDTPQIEAWRAEIEELDKLVVPSQSEGGGVTGNLLQGVMIRSFEIRLQQIASAERIDALREATSRVEARLARLPEVERRHAQLTRDVVALEAEVAQLEPRLAEARRMLDAAALPFTLVAEAWPPPRPAKSNKKQLAIMAAGGLGALWCGLVIAVAALDPRARTTGELKTVLKDVPALAEFPRGADDATGEHARRAARSLRMLVRDKGAVVLFAPAGAQDSANRVAMAIARTLALWGERVLVINGLGDGGGNALASLGMEEPGGGTRALIDGDMDAPVETATGNLSYLSPGDPVVQGDELATARCRESIRRIAGQYDITLVCGPSPVSTVDAGHLALASDGVVIVQRAMGPMRWTASQAASVFEELEVPVVAAVLEGVVPPFTRPSGSRR